MTGRDPLQRGYGFGEIQLVLGLSFAVFGIVLFFSDEAHSSVAVLTTGLGYALTAIGATYNRFQGQSDELERLKDRLYSHLYPRQKVEEQTLEELFDRDQRLGGNEDEESVEPN